MDKKELQRIIIISKKPGTPSNRSIPMEIHTTKSVAEVVIELIKFNNGPIVNVLKKRVEKQNKTQTQHLFVSEISRFSWHYISTFSFHNS